RAIARAAVGGRCIDCVPTRGLPWQRFRFHGAEVDLEGVPDEALDVRVESPMGAVEAHLPPKSGGKDVTLAIAGSGTIRGRADSAERGQIPSGRACLLDPW